MDIFGYEFKGPFGRVLDVEDGQGVYAVMLLKGMALELLDVGASRHVRGRLVMHERRDAWEREAQAHGWELRYAAHYTPGLRDSGREAIADRLRGALGRACGTT
jgi:hypothetical protein